MSEVTYGAVARADAMLAGYRMWWTVNRWPLCAEHTCPQHGAANRAEAEQSDG